MISEIWLKSFRNYKNLNLELLSGIHLLVGKNGQGKSNFLEAIYLFSYLKSFRKSSDKELIPHSSQHYYLKGAFENEDIQSIEMGYESNGKAIKMDGKKTAAIMEAVGKIRTVLFSDTDIELLYGAPVVRRSYMDATLSVTDKNYLYSLHHYKKVLKMRNAAIKSFLEGKGNKDSVRAWDNQLIRYGSYIITRRNDFIENIAKICRNLYPRFTTHQLEMNLKYSPSFKWENDSIEKTYENYLEKEFTQELRKATTLLGPHRDEISIKNKNFLLKKFASKGQARAACLILKLAQLEYLEKNRDAKCILLLDDVLLDLDNENKRNFIQILGSERQCFFTATSVEEFCGLQGRLYEVKEGNIRKI